MSVLPWLLLHVIWMLQNINTPSGQLGTNVAYRQYARICLKQAPELVDGDKETINSESQLACSIIQSREIYIRLGNNFSIRYVIIYLGNITLGNSTSHSLDKFYVFLGKTPHRRCGEFPGIVSEMSRPSKPMRVNCMFQSTSHEDIHIFPKFSPVVLSEIEVYSYDAEDGNGVTINRGCYKNFKANVSTTFTDIWTCKLFCKNRSMYFMAIEGARCLCGYDFVETDLLPSSNCSVRCASSNYSCGGENAYSVYLLSFKFPYVVYCVIILNISEGIQLEHNSVKKCIVRCSSSIFMWLKGDRCACTNDSSNFDFSHGVHKLCDQKCPGDSEEICGGREAARVYTTCQDDDNILPSCFQLLQCKGGLYDEHGVCEAGCKSGFVGAHCLEAGESTELDTYTEPVVTSEKHHGLNTTNRTVLDDFTQDGPGLRLWLKSGSSDIVLLLSIYFLLSRIVLYE